MKTEYRFVSATDKHAAQLAEDIPQADVDEIWAGVRMEPLELLQASLRASVDPIAVLADGEVFCIFGVTRPETVLSSISQPWMLASKALRKHRWAFLRQSKVVVEWMQGHNEILTNYVDARHVVAIRWLRWLGFELEPAKPYGPDGLPFYRFSRSETK